jgi:hypothetical protein
MGQGRAPRREVPALDPASNNAGYVVPGLNNANGRYLDAKQVAPKALFQDRLMKLVPIIQVVEINRVFRPGGIVGNAICP